MKKYLILCFAVALATLSCQQEPIEPVGPTGGKKVSFNAELPGDENAGFDFEGGQLKHYWEQGDQLLVTYTGENGEEVQEIFTYTSTEKNPSGEFTFEDSHITPETVFSVQYPKEPDWSIQTGTPADLPDYLVATDVKGSIGNARLERRVTFLRIIEAAGAAEGKYSEATLNKISGGCTFFAAPGKPGAITIRPKEGFDLSKGGDFFVTVMFDGATTSAGPSGIAAGGEADPVFRVYFANNFRGISLDGQCFDPVAPYLKLDWVPAKDYQSGLWYSITNRPLTAVTSSVISPR